MNQRVLWVMAVFVALVALLAIGLRHDPRELPSPLIGKPAPAFALPLLHQPDKTFSSKEPLGKVWLFNVWASWCVACREEHAVLSEFAKTGAAPLYGLNYKDQRNAGLGWLRNFGNPYTDSLFDPDGRIGIDYGVYGVPETFVIDRSGVIRYKHIGPMTPEVLSETIEPLVRRLNG